MAFPTKTSPRFAAISRRAAIVQPEDEPAGSTAPEDEAENEQAEPAPAGKKPKAPPIFPNAKKSGTTKNYT